VTDAISAIVEVTLFGTRPAPRRVLAVPYSLVLSRFHSVLQVAMGWQPGEGHVFVGQDLIASNLNEVTGSDAEDESLRTLDQLLPFIGAEALYMYDFTREWRHRLRLLDLESGRDEIKLLKGSGRCPTEGAAAPAKRTNRKKSSTSGKHKSGREADAVDLAAINQELDHLSNGWRRRRGRAAKNASREMVLLDTGSIRASYLNDLQSVRSGILEIEDELARHESQDLPEFRRCVNVEFGRRFSILRELHQEIHWYSARLALVQKLMQHGIRPVGRAYLEALQIETGQAPYPDFPPQRDENSSGAPQTEKLFDRETIKDFVSAASNESLTEEEVESLTQEVLEEASARDLAAECKTLYRKIVSLLHPDRVGEMTSERKELWLRAQGAYNDGDVLSLRSILDRCGAGTHDQCMTCSEILEAIAGATMQLQAIELFRERVAKEPSWNFCRLIEKRKKSRLRRVTKDLDEEENILKIQLAELQRECQSLEERAKDWERQEGGAMRQLDLFR
jgi:hypothetical protein